MKHILHISDLHFSDNNNYGFGINSLDKLLTAIFDDLNTLESTQNIIVDSIFFTGDIAFSGKKEQYSLVEKLFINPVSEKLGIDRNKIFIVPGNHDVDRSKIGILEKNARSGNNEMFLGELFHGINSGSQPWGRLDAYSDFVENFYKSVDSVVSKEKLFQVHKASKELFVICANSAWLAQDDYDKNNIMFSNRQLEVLVRGLPKQSKKILLAHHPLNWLSEADRLSASSFIEKNISMFCFGHMHEFKQVSESSFSENTTLNIQAGTLDFRNENSGYSIISLNENYDISNGRITYRKFDKDVGAFCSWDNRGRDGVFDFSTDAMITFDTRKFSEVSQKILNEIDSDLMINVGLKSDCKKSLRELFIEPNLETPSFLAALSSQSVGSTNSLKSITSSNGCFGIVGAKNSGKSFFLKYMFIKVLEKQISYDFSEIGFFYDLKDGHFKNINSIFSSLCGQYSFYEYKTSFEQKLRYSIESGTATIFLDNVSVKNSSSIKALKSFMTKYKKCRYVISIDDSEGLDVSAVFNNIENLNYDAASIGILKRKDVREIVRKWTPSIPSLCENVIYQDVTKVVNNSQLPHSHFVYSMLLAIYEVEQNFNNILSESDIIENFIEILLKKHCMDSSFDRPQYKVLLHFMGFLSKKIFLDNVFKFDANYIYQTALDFNKETLNSYEVYSYIDPLVSSGIIINKDGGFSFSQVAFWYYSMSYYMKHDIDLKNIMLGGNNFLDYDKIVEYYSSQNASSLEILNFISENIDGLVNEIACFVKSENDIDILSMDLDNISEISILEIASDVEDIELKIQEMKVDRDKDDEELDNISPLDNSSNGCHDRSDIIRDENDIIYFTARLRNLLSLYSRVFRNSELLMGANQILEVFDKVVEGYVFYTKFLIASLDDSYIIPMILPTIEKKLEKDNVTQREKDELVEQCRAFLYIVRSTLPNYVQSIMSYDLSSRKPRVENIVRQSLLEV